MNVPPEPSTGPIDPAQLRISDADRHKVSEVLRQAAGDGRLDIDELEERLEATYKAKVYADLVPITLDLPSAPNAPAVPGSHVPATRPSGTPVPIGRRHDGTHGTHDVSFAMMGEQKRIGAWDIGTVHTATTFMGGVVIDLREARFPAGEVIINANAVMGSVEVIVDERTDVRVEGYGVMGSFQEGRARVPRKLDEDSPTVRVRGVALMGSVEVKRKGPPGEIRRRLLGY